MKVQSLYINQLSSQQINSQNNQLDQANLILEDRKKEFRAKYEAKVSALKKSYEKLIEKADTQERKEVLQANLNGHLDKLKDHYRQEFNDPRPKKDYTKEELLRIDKENKFRAGIDAQKYVKDFKKIGTLKIKETTIYRPVLTKQKELSDEYLEILGDGTVALNPRYFKQDIHERNSYAQFNRSSKELFWLIRKLSNTHVKIFDYIYNSHWVKSGKDFFEARATIALVVGCCIDTVTDAFNNFVSLGLIRRYLPGYNVSNTIRINERLLQPEYALVIKRAFYEAKYSINRVSEYATKAYKKACKAIKSSKARIAKKTVILLEQINQKVKELKKKQEERRQLEQLVKSGIESSWIKTLLKKFSFKVIQHNLNKVQRYMKEKVIISRGALIYRLCLKDH